MLAMIEGKHRRLHGPSLGRQYISGIDIAGEAEEAYSLLNDFQPRRDSTVVTIAEIDRSSGAVQPGIHMVEHYCWTGEKHARLLPKLVHLLGKVWRCSKIVVDATGIGQPVASLLREKLGSRVEAFGFTTHTKSEPVFELLSTVNSGRLKMYARDGSAEYRRFFHELEYSRACYQAGRRLNFYVDRVDWHDDFLISLALTVRAARGLLATTGQRDLTYAI
jgi:hypothetical protein